VGGVVVVRDGGGSWWGENGKKMSRIIQESS